MTIQDDAISFNSTDMHVDGEVPKISEDSTLRHEVHKSLARYFENLGDQSVSNLYQMVLTEVEAPLFDAVMRHTSSNQSKASIMLGLNRGTLRKKLKQYGLL